MPAKELHDNMKVNFALATESPAAYYRFIRPWILALVGYRLFKTSVLQHWGFSVSRRCAALPRVNFNASPLQKQSVSAILKMRGIRENDSKRFHEMLRNA
jgi:hypothetical protein